MSSSYARIRVFTYSTPESVTRCEVGTTLANFSCICAILRESLSVHHTNKRLSETDDLFLQLGLANGDQFELELKERVQHSFMHVAVSVIQLKKAIFF